MNAWEIMFGWNPIKQPPTKDGRYYVACLRREGGKIDINTYDYTVRYGWNTNKYSIDNAINFDGYDAFWVPALKVTIEEASA